MEKSTVEIKSNVSLKSRGFIPPMDNLPSEYFSVLLDNKLSEHQRTMKLKMLFWANTIIDEEGSLVEDRCYKGCINCGHQNNDCKRPQNRPLV